MVLGHTGAGSAAAAAKLKAVAMLAASWRCAEPTGLRLTTPIDPSTGPGATPLAAPLRTGRGPTRAGATTNVRTDVWAYVEYAACAARLPPSPV